MSWRVEFTKRAAKEVAAIPKKQRILILAWIQKNLADCDNPRAVIGGKQLVGTQAGWRWRAGNYRILGRLKDEVLLIEVVRVGHRQGVYMNLPEL